MTDDLSKRLLGLEFKSDHSIKSKCLKWIVKKILPTLLKMKSTQSKIKPIKTKKELGTTYFLECKDFTHNFRPQKIKITNKVPREKSNCVVCRSNKSGFLKQKRNNKK